jgi:hypothetical protein
MEDVILWLRSTPIPMALVASGLACMILAIASELPPVEGEAPLLVPRKAVPITGTVLLLFGVPLSIQWPEGLFPFERLIAYWP